MLIGEKGEDLRMDIGIINTSIEISTQELL